MATTRSVIVSSPPRGRIHDFDLVVLDGRLLLVGTHDVSRHGIGPAPSSARRQRSVKVTSSSRLPETSASVSRSST